MSGLLRREGQELVAEYWEKTTDYNTMGQERGPLRTVRIPLAEVESIGVHWRFPWGYKVVLTSHSLVALDGLPNCDGPTAHFNIAWRDRMRARELVTATTLQLIDRSLKELGEGGVL